MTFFKTTIVVVVFSPGKYQTTDVQQIAKDIEAGEIAATCKVVDSEEIANQRSEPNGKNVVGLTMKLNRRELRFSNHHSNS